MNINKKNHDLEQALKECADEPIHIPGSIQPHGYLLVVDDDFNILKASENFLEFSENTIEQLIGSALSTYIQPGSIDELKKLVVEGALNALRYCAVTLEYAGKQLDCDAVVHRSDEVMIVELEPRHPDDQQLEQQDFYHELMSFSVHLHKIKERDELFSYLVEKIRNLTGYGRVMLYQFDADWNGEIMAESRIEPMHTYLGLNFPASDIPEQARKLYAVNYLRLISDTDFAPVQILPNDKHGNGSPINLSFSCLRSVSPVHLEYLNNMHVKSSMSISVMQNDRLWGMVVCHHNKPFRPAYAVRMAAELLTHNFSAFLSSYTQIESSSLEKMREFQYKEISLLLDLDKPLIDILAENYQSLLDLLQADGLLLKLGDQEIAHGEIPTGRAPAALAQWVENNADDQLFVSNTIVEKTGLELFKESNISGAIVGPVSHPMDNCLMFFRREYSKEKHWGGKPEKNISKTATGYKLAPRASFERWKQTTSGESKTWSDSDIELASSISRLVLAKYYEHSLRKVTDNLDSVINNSNALIYIVDIQGVIVQMNGTALQSFELDTHQAVGHHFSDVFDEQLAKIIEDRIQLILSSGESSRINENFINKDENFHLATVNFPLYDTVRNIFAICSISTDVSELLHIQNNLTSSNKELERLAFIASHDLQEPIRMISTFASLLKEDYVDKLDEQAEEYIEYMLNSSDRMRVLIHDLLQFSRLQTKEAEPPIIETDKVILEVAKELKITDLLGDAVITIEPNLPHLQMKSEHFTCVVQNLIGNSLKYKNENEPARILVQCKDDGPYWHFSITDNGIGIKEEYLKNIFVIFKRLHNQEEYKGTGIGLAICTKIVENHNGKIWAESTPGSGSTFHFTIPKKHKTVSVPDQQLAIPQNA